MEIFCLTVFIVVCNPKKAVDLSQGVWQILGKLFPNCQRCLQCGSVSAHESSVPTLPTDSMKLALTLLIPFLPNDQGSAATKRQMP